MASRAQSVGSAPYVQDARIERKSVGVDLIQPEFVCMASFN